VEFEIPTTGVKPVRKPPQYAGDGLGSPKSENILPTQIPEKNKEKPLFDLQIIAFLGLKKPRP